MIDAAAHVHARIPARVRGVARTTVARWARVGTAALIAVAFVGVASSVGSSEPRASAGASSTGSPPSSGAGRGAPPGTIGYGLAEPAGSLPGVETRDDVAAWSRIRADVAGSGACWLRTDLDTWLMRAIQGLDWLGTPMPCATSPGSPVKVLAILDSQTVWAGLGLCPDVAFSPAFEARRRDFTLDDWRQLVRCVAREFAGRISAYEIWNEPLLSNSILGYQDGSAEHYVDLLRVAYAEIRAADPTATVIALGGSDVYAGGDQDRLDLMRTFSSSLVAMGARQYADAISLHAYPWGRSDGSVWTSYADEIAFQDQTWAKPVWITETGQRATDGATQTDYMAAAYRTFVQAGIQHIFWFSITDQPDGSFGLRDRPVEAALRAFALGHAGGGDGRRAAADSVPKPDRIPRRA